MNCQVPLDTEQLNSTLGTQTEASTYTLQLEEALIIYLPCHLARVDEINFGMIFTKYITLVSTEPTIYTYTIHAVALLERSFFVENVTFRAVC